jgi:mannose-6-phosphate isomerase-like protein (cupin superfamily)
MPRRQTWVNHAPKRWEESMKAVLFATLSALVVFQPATVSAQSAPPLKTFASAADVQALIAKARAITPVRPLVSQPLIGTSAYRASVDYRALVTPASLHDNENELWVFLVGTGTLTTGGSLVEAKRTDAANSTGTSITGGTPTHVAPGDVMIVPAGVAHQIAPDAGAIPAMITMHMPSLPAPASAAPAPGTYMSAADIQGLIAKAKAMPPKPLISQPVVGAGTSRFNLEYRAGAPAPASIHDAENELMVFVDGTGIITLGGTLVEGTRPNPTNQSGSSISGGVPTRVAKGDVLIVPAGVAHQIAADAGSAIAVLTLHVPQPWPGK